MASGFRYPIFHPQIQFRLLLRPRWGVRGSLFAAFAVIAGMAIVISAGAGLVLAQLGKPMVDLSGQDIPRLAASLQLAAQSASLASQGPALLASRSAEALDERAKKMKETQQVALGQARRDHRTRRRQGGGRRARRNRQEHRRHDQEPRLGRPRAARGRALHDKQYDALRAAQAGFVAAASPAMMDAQTQINAVLGSADLSADDATRSRADRRAARRRHRQRPSGGLGNERRAVGQQQRHAGCDREGIQGHRARASNRTSNCCRKIRAPRR